LLVRLYFMFQYILADKRFIFILFIINLLGTIYGFYWYEYQLANTPTIFLIFVPDSPMASMFFTIFFLFFLFNQNATYIESLDIITLIKYMIWAIIMNVLSFITTGYLNPSGYMLIFSHARMAIQGLLYAPFYKIKMRHLVIAAIWTLHNDVIDYVFGMIDRKSTRLNSSHVSISYAVFCLKNNIFRPGPTSGRQGKSLLDNSSMAQTFSATHQKPPGSTH